MLGPKAGSTFRDLCNDAAIKWQKMWWFYAPVYRMRTRPRFYDNTKTYEGRQYEEKMGAHRAITAGVWKAAALYGWPWATGTGAS